MVKITIVGWYGTETIGDRAILAGIIFFLSDAFNDKYKIYLGSLYPFFSERTLNEDTSFYKKVTGGDVDMEIVDSKSPHEINNSIKKSDIVMMGGGPLMHIGDLYVIKYALRIAKKNKKKTILFGCGVGPLFTQKHKKAVIDIIKHSDVVILRDNESKENLRRIYKEFNIFFPENNIDVSVDPALRCAYEYDKFGKKYSEGENYLAINLRDFPAKYSKNDTSRNINNFLFDFFKKISSTFYDKKIKLIPMHYFYMGGDDRFFLNDLKLNIRKNEMIEVQNSNLSLEETMCIFKNAYLNIGMRFHSIILQTILSGKNYILDYTEPKKGKISGFLSDIDKGKFYNDRYVQLQLSNKTIDDLFDNYNCTERFKVDYSILEQKFNIYNKILLK